MNKECLYEYLLKNTSRPDCIELLQYPINRKIYHYGDNFISPNPIYNKRKNYIRDTYHFLIKFKNQKKISNSGPIIISNSYFTFNSELQKIGFEPITPFWITNNNVPYLNELKLLLRTNNIDKHLEYAPLNEITSPTFFKLIDDYKEDILKIIKKYSISSVVFSNDLGFHERLFIDLFKYLNKPTFIFAHGGSPIVYNGVDDNRTDFLIVWGDAIKKEYIQTGIRADKIIVSGHPYYTESPKLPQTYSTKDILVLSKAPQGAPTDSTKVHIFDRGKGIVYIKMIETVLKNQGLKKARLRLHPSENPGWYSNFIDNNFFTIDREPLYNSLRKSTLIIGGTTSVFQESLYFGKPYIVFEPTDSSDTDVYGIKLRSPFDNSNPKVPVCKTIDQLENAIKNKIVSDNSIISDYFRSPFDISFLKKLIS